MNIHITVDAYAGCNIGDIIKDMVSLADRLQISIWCDLNGVRTLARPGDRASDVYDAWEDELHSKRAPKMASASRRS